MKNKVRLYFAIIVLSSVIITFFFFTEKRDCTNLFLENIEALAADEFNPNVACLGIGSLDCPYGKEKVKYILNGYSFKFLMPK